jgi:hypothetical protein
VSCCGDGAAGNPGPPLVITPLPLMAPSDGTRNGEFAPDRVISTVDPEARHGHKTAARGFDGYKMECGGTSPAQP